MAFSKYLPLHILRPLLEAQQLPQLGVKPCEVFALGGFSMGKHQAYTSHGNMWTMGTSHGHFTLMEVPQLDVKPHGVMANYGP